MFDVHFLIYTSQTILEAKCEYYLHFQYRETEAQGSSGKAQFPRSTELGSDNAKCLW